VKKKSYISTVPVFSNSIAIGSLLIIHNKIEETNLDVTLPLTFLAELTAIAMKSKTEVVEIKENTFSHPVMSKRQTEILKQLCNGLTTVEIAKLLNYSPGTVRLEISKIYSMLGVRTRQEAAFAAQKFMDFNK